MQDYHANIQGSPDYIAEKCARNQNNEHFHFLTGGTDVTPEEAKVPEVRHCDVPYGKAIHVIIYGGTCNETEGKTYEIRKECADLGLGKNESEPNLFTAIVDSFLQKDTKCRI